MKLFIKLRHIASSLQFIFLCLTFLYSSVSVAESVEDLDYFESVNRSIFVFNDKADQYVLKPVAKAYKFVTPRIVNKGITNIFNNFDDVETFINSLFQLKFHNAIVSLNRVIYNTTFGLGGVFDVATSFDLINTEEDFGQTLGYWGYENSTYLMLPFLGPSTVRDFSGRLVDSTFEPLQYVDDIHQDTLYLSTGIKLLDKRADLLGAENLLFGSDRYSFIRSAYYQNRNFLINDGAVEDPFSDADFDDYDEFKF
ncbi:MAG: phospholipid-binding lipoprotein MlaA [Oleiphilaceae bacterium]